MTHRESFERYHEDNPKVYRLLVSLARGYKSAGRTRFGIRRLWELLRWEMIVERDAADDFRLNNNHLAYYSRLIMEREPDLAGFFQTRGADTEEEE